MNRDTEIFVASKELEQALNEFNDSCSVLRDTVQRATQAVQLAGDKLNKAARRALDVLKPTKQV